MYKLHDIQIKNQFFQIQPINIFCKSFIKQQSIGVGFYFIRFFCKLNFYFLSFSSEVKNTGFQ